MIAEYFYSRNMTLSQAFSFLDADMGGTVTWEEFVRGINLCLDQTANHRVSSSDLWPIFKRFDRDGDNRISLEEFSSQFASKGTRAQSWYDDDMRRGSGRTIGYGAPVIAPNVAAERRVDDIICRIGAAIVRTGFTPLQLFQKVDLDSNGRLSWAELERMILSFQPDLSMTERQAIFSRFDRDGSQDVDVNEFCGCMDRCNAQALVNVEALFKGLGDRFRSSGQTVSDIFHVFDRNYDGFLQLDEWARAMKTFDVPTPTLSDADIEAVFKRFDVNGDGYMSIQEVDTFFRDCIQRSQHSQVQAQTTYTGSQTYQVMPTYQPPPPEEAWESEVLETVRSCLSVGRSGLSITEVFRRLDINNNESMDVVEFQRMVTAYRQDLAQAHVEALFLKVNTSGTGHITMSEFVRRFG